MGPFLLHAALRLAAPFSGLFLFAGSNGSVAAYCQLTTARGTVTGDCYSASVDARESGGVRRSHFVVTGDVDGGRVLLRIPGLFGSKATWGTAIANGDGFALEAPSEQGVQTVQFRRASVAEANQALARVGAHGSQVASAAHTAATYKAAQRQYAELTAEYPAVLKHIDALRADSIHYEAQADSERAMMALVGDSIAKERDGWKKGSLQSHRSAHEWRMNSALYRVRTATEDLRDEIAKAAEWHAAMSRDSAYIATHHP